MILFPSPNNRLERQILSWVKAAEAWLSRSAPAVYRGIFNLMLALFDE